MKQLVFILFLALGLFLRGFAQDNEEYYFGLLDSANAAYVAEDYSKAVDFYEQILQEGYFAADIYYNLGNAYYKKGELAAAILFYEKALKIEPTHEDAAYNLKLSNKSIVDKIDAVPVIFYKKWWKAIINSLTINQWLLITLILVFGLAFLIYQVIFQKAVALKRLYFYLSISFFMVALITFLIGLQKSKSVKSDRDAIVFAPTLNVLSAPKNSAQTLYVIHEGLKVRIVKEDTEWLRIALPDGNLGWIRKENITVI